MININKLKGSMISAGFANVEDAARAIGMKPSTMYRRLKTGVFNSDEMQSMIDTYEIDDPMTIFFTK